MQPCHAAHSCPFVAMPLVSRAWKHFASPSPNPNLPSPQTLIPPIPNCSVDNLVCLWDNTDCSLIKIRMALGGAVIWVLGFKYIYIYISSLSFYVKILCACEHLSISLVKCTTTWLVIQQLQYAKRNHLLIFAYFDALISQSVLVHLFDGSKSNLIICMYTTSLCKFMWLSKFKK